MGYRELGLKKKILDVGDGNIEEDTFLKSFDLMGAQRHLKAIGIFSRLYLRDKKITYLSDIPRTLSYLYQTAAEYPELNELYAWLGENVMPDAEQKILAATTVTSIVLVTAIARKQSYESNDSGSRERRKDASFDRKDAQTLTPCWR